MDQHASLRPPFAANNAVAGRGAIAHVSELKPSRAKQKQKQVDFARRKLQHANETSLFRHLLCIASDDFESGSAWIDGQLPWPILSPHVTPVVSSGTMPVTAPPVLGTTAEQWVPGAKWATEVKQGHRIIMT